MSELTKEQSEAARLIKAFAKDKSIYGDNWMFCLSGFAGTGKTFLLQRLINDSIHPKIICCAPTGKAASVLQSKLQGVQVRTLHQALYIPKGRCLSALDALSGALAGSSGAAREILLKQIAEEKKRLSEQDVQFSVKDNSMIGPGTLAIIDEASMVSPKILDDLRSTGCKALFVGDSGQLPPVHGENWFLKRKHDASLHSIQRQASESPIIRLSMQIREGNVNKSEFLEGSCRIVSKESVSNEEWDAADQILTGRNESRKKINRFIRKRLGFSSSPDPFPGEKMICLKNDWKTSPNFINGVIFRSLSKAVEGETGEEMLLDILYEGVGLLGIPYYPFDTRSNYDPKLIQEPPELRRGLMEMDFGYAITVHKSQGSEWDSVLVADDRMQESNRPFRQKWLYTAVTRASKKLTIVQ